MMASDTNGKWYVMRDLKRANAILPAYKQLAALHIEVFTPMRWCLKNRNGKQVRVYAPVIQDLLFVHGTRNVIDPIVEKTPTLQYRFRKGGTYCEPMVVSDDDMQRFMYAVGVAANPKFYLPEEILPSMCGNRIRIVGGPLNGYEGRLLSVCGSKAKRLLVELPDFFIVGVEVEPEYVRVLGDGRSDSDRTMEVESARSRIYRNDKDK